jgi:hypothetical protein
MKTLEFIYQETEIHFLVNPNKKDVMINATEMAKLFNKRVKNFLRLEETKNFINFQVQKNYIGSDVSRYIKKNIYYSNNKAGTFMCRKLALKFAAWLDVEFEDWIFDTIDNILFSKTEEISETITLKETKEKELKDLIAKAYKDDNKELIKLLELEKELQTIKRAESKAVSKFKDQFKIQFS